MKRILPSLVLGSVMGVGALAVGCGGSDGGGETGSPIDSGVDQEKEVSDVSAEETLEICEATAEYMRQQIPPQEICKAVGMEAYGAAFEAGEITEAEPACEEATDECVDSPPPDFYIECDPTDTEPIDCSNTVGELEACLVAVVDVQAEVIADFDLPVCEDILDWIQENDTENLGEGFELDIESLPECASLDDECKDIFADDDTSSEAMGGAGGN